VAIVNILSILHPFYDSFVMTNDEPHFVVSTVISKKEILMKRMHIHIAVDELEKNIGFYSTMFGSAPTLERENYAKWYLNDPKINFAISIKEGGSGINHLGVQVDSESELQEIAQRLESAEINFSSQKGTSCCYSHSNKHWALDPQGIAWESFHTLSDTPVFSGGANANSGESPSCCIPLSISQSSDQKEDCCIPNENDATECCS